MECELVYNNLEGFYFQNRNLDDAHIDHFIKTVWEL
jgi:hypothetical protein